MRVATLMLLLAKAVDTHCVEGNRSTYVIPTATYCVPDASESGDNYFFGPCKDACPVMKHKCMYANGRERYCLVRDAHLCGLVDRGPFAGYLIVECG